MTEHKDQYLLLEEQARETLAQLADLQHPVITSIRVEAEQESVEVEGYHRGNRVQVVVTTTPLDGRRSGL